MAHWLGWFVETDNHINLNATHDSHIRVATYIFLLTQTLFINMFDLSSWSFYLLPYRMYLKYIKILLKIILVTNIFSVPCKQGIRFPSTKILFIIDISTGKYHYSKLSPPKRRSLKNCSWTKEGVMKKSTRDYISIHDKVVNRPGVAGAVL